MNLDELLAALSQALGENRDDLISGIEKKVGGLYQVIFQKGHDVGYGKKNHEITAANDKIAKLSNDIAAREQAIEELKAEGPEKHKKVIEGYKAEIATLTEAHKQAIAQKDAVLSQERLDRSIADLKARLIARGVMPDYADVKLQSQEVRNRIKFEPDGSRQVLQAGKDIPFAVTGTEDALDLLANELHSATPQNWQTSKVIPGSGDGQPQNGAPMGGAKGQSDFFKGIREKKQAETKAQKEAQSENPALSRMGVAASPSR